MLITNRLYNIKNRKNTLLSITTNPQTLLNNDTNQSIRIVSLYVANIHGTNDGNVTININDNFLTKTINVPADSTLTVIGGNDIVYLNNNDILTISASANNTLDAIISYEEIINA